MSKKFTIEITPAQARALIWAMNTFEASYEGFGDKEAGRATRTLNNFYVDVAEYADKFAPGR
jgi:hypothetical protein